MKTETCKLYFWQMSSKSILIILSYTVSKLVHFLRRSVGGPIHSERRNCLVDVVVWMQRSDGTRLRQ